ncbi:unnamed protein product [Rotaria sp. Silwood2]|nr:unnamed protein product [Rotaria sp. Silwood2]
MIINPEFPMTIWKVNGDNRNWIDIEFIQHLYINMFENSGLDCLLSGGSAWLITGGTNAGIMRLVGDIVGMNSDRFRRIPLIGIATWGCVCDYTDLDVHGGNVYFGKSSSDKKGEAPLEANHTKFIFVDDGTAKKFGGEITFRARLEQAISRGYLESRKILHSSNPHASLSEPSSLQSEYSDAVPVVLLVVEGGPNTVRTIHQAVVENNIPAVLLDGTGRCCDLFAKAFRLYNKYYVELIDETLANVDQSILTKCHNELKSKLREELKNELRGISGARDKPATSNTNASLDDKTDYFELIYECICTRKDFINIISLDPDNPVELNIDLVILQALLNAASANDNSKTDIQKKREQLHLALEWNRVDIVKNYIMKNHRDWEKIDLKELFLLALKRNQIEFVKLFLDHDFSLTDLFRNKNEFLRLYMMDKKETDDFTNYSEDPLRMIYARIIQPLIGDFFQIDNAFSPRQRALNLKSTDKNDGATCRCCGSRHNHTSSDGHQSASLQLARKLYSYWLNLIYLQNVIKNNLSYFLS